MNTTHRCHTASWLIVNYYSAGTTAVYIVFLQRFAFFSFLQCFAALNITIPSTERVWLQVNLWFKHTSFPVRVVSIPADAERKLLSAGFDLVLSLHVSHVFCRVTVDSQNGVAWTQVTLGCLAARCHLTIFTHTGYAQTHTTIQAHPRKEKRK